MKHPAFSLLPALALALALCGRGALGAEEAGQKNWPADP
jgi:hypothetical protein